MTEVEADALRNRVEELQSLLGVGNDDVSQLLTVLDATPQQCEMIGFMLRRSVATRTALHTVLFGARPDCDQPEIKLIDVQMVRVRVALKKVGVEVRTEWGSGGWAIPAADKARLRALMAGAADAITADEREALRGRRMAFLEGA
jgi:hypothetical protein